MQLQQIFNTPENSFLYMERLVNDGSPSNFTFRYMTSRKTCPLFTDKFELPVLVDNDEAFSDYGIIPEGLKLQRNFLPIHPDWNASDYVAQHQIAHSIYFACPTSSSRTVKIENTHYFFKLAYPGIIGRITRELETKHVLSSLDINQIFERCVLASAPSCFAFLPECGGRVFKGNDDKEIGFVIRDTIPKGKNTKKVYAYIPAFALYSKDRLRNDLPILIQLLDAYNTNTQKRKAVLEQLIFPVIDVFFYSVFQEGIIPEMHSQNFLIGIDSNGEIINIILRDLESMDKDITLMKNLGKSINLDSYPFKCIYADQYNYKIKHSFMYDHKLGEYFFTPICRLLTIFNVFERGELEKIIRDYVNLKYGLFLEDFFPENGKWYKFENVLVDRTKCERPYIEVEYPQFR